MSAISSGNTPLEGVYTKFLIDPPLPLLVLLTRNVEAETMSHFLLKIFVYSILELHVS